MAQRTAVLLHSQTVGYGGGERQLATLALTLDPARWEVHVLRQHPGGGWEPKLRDAGIAFYHLQLSSYVGAQAWREVGRLRAYLKQHQIRITQGFDYTANVFVTPVARSVSGVVALSTQRCETKLIPGKYKKATHWVHKLAHGVVVNSHTLSRQLQEQEGFAASKIHVSENGIDTELFSPGAARDGSELVFGCVCVLREEKRLDLLLEAFAGIETPARLLLVGDGPEKERLRELAAKLGINDRCEFRPATQQVTACLHEMDVFVLPSRSEGLSNSLMEAMSCGLTVIASSAPANAELIAHGETGLIFENGNAASLREQMRVASQRQPWGAAARRRVEQHYSNAVALGRMEDIYMRVLHEDR